MGAEGEKGGGAILHFIHSIVTRLCTGSQVRLVLMPGAGLPGFSSAEEELPVCAYARLTPPIAKRTMLSGVRETEWQGAGQSGPPGVSSQVCCLHPGDQSQPAIS